VQAVQYRGPKAGRWQKIGRYMTVIGLANALVVAPLVSANFADDQFNTDRYTQWAGYSLAVSGVGVTLMLTNGYKNYPLREAGRRKAGEPLWML
jgi:hypothetical protein